MLRFSPLMLKIYLCLPMFKLFPKYFIILSVIIISFSSCKKEDEFNTDFSARLEFSQDTVLFDTVFVQTGSATEIFTVRNKNDRAIKISSVRIGGGNASYYRLNVNGTPGKSFSDVEIGANDSIFIFVEVTIPDPNSPNTPFIVNDSIVFNLNGHFQQVNLVSWGQRAHFHHGNPAVLLNCNDVWTNDLPHVIYGYAIVDSGCTLTIEHGARVHFSPGSLLWVLSSGTLKVNGTLQEPVTFEGSRLGAEFKDNPGQWHGIWLSSYTHNRLFNNVADIGPGAKNCSINYAIIKNGNIGLQVDTVFSPGSTGIQLDNTVIKNMAGVGLYALGSSVKANNCVFANCGQYLAALVFGGNHRFLHCTFADYWSRDNRQTPSILINNYYLNSVRSIDSAYFGNCIVYGNIGTEIGLDSLTASPAGSNNYFFDHCLLKVEANFSTSSSLHYNSIIRGNDPLFKNTDDNNYEIDSTSIAVDAGILSITNLSPVLSTDLKGTTRPLGNAPDLGAYERR